MSKGPSTMATRQVPIGARLRMARLARNLTLDDVASTVGISQGYISRLERDQVSPSVGTLVSICDTVGLRMGELFDAPSTDVVRAGEGSAINFGGEGASELLLTPSSEPNVQVIHSVIDPGGSAGPELYSLDCDVEFAYIVSGTLDIVVGDTAVTLGQGDAMTFRGRDPHRWLNASAAVPCEVLWVMAPAP